VFSFLKKQPPHTKRSGAGAVLSYTQVGRATWTPKRYDALADVSYAKNVIAYRCMKEIAQSAATVDVLLFQGDRELVTHPVLSLLNRPNPSQGRVTFLEMVFSQLLLAGNAYIEAVENDNGLPQELWALRPDRMQVIAGRYGLPVGYEYSAAGQTKRWAADDVSGRSLILHLKQYNPLNDWYGQSAVETASYAIDQFNAASVWNQALLQNGCRPSGALVVEGKEEGGLLTDEQYTRLKEQLEENYTGAMQAGRPLLLEGGLKWVDMMLSPKDMDFMNIKHTAAREIALAFGYPPMLLGIPGDNTYANQKEARLALWEQTIIPLLRQVLDSMSHWLSPYFGEELRLTFDEDSISALNSKREMLWTRINAATFLSDAEKRIAVGYEQRQK
jgi:HK97 family phage portal protein